MKTLFTFFALLFTIGTVNGQYCTTDNRFTEQPYFTDEQIHSVYDGVYGEAVDFRGNLIPLKFNIHYPKLNADPLAKRPFILLIHGGGFVNGTKEKMDLTCQEFAKRGFAAATISYRLGREGGCTDPLDKEKAVYRAAQDANAAMRYVVANAGVLHIDTNWLFVGGGSAGSATAFNVIYYSQAEINLYHPGLETQLGGLYTSGNALTNTFSIKGIFNNWGGAELRTLEADELVPMIAFHAIDDPTADIDSTEVVDCPDDSVSHGSRTIHYWLQENDVCSELNVKLSDDHAFYLNPAGTAFRVSRAVCFFKSLFCNECTSLYTTEKLLPNCSGAMEERLASSTGDELSVYPNPVTGKAIINGMSEQTLVSLRDVRGIELLQQRSAEVDLSGYDAGIYFLVITDGAQTRSLRIVKQ